MRGDIAKVASMAVNAATASESDDPLRWGFCRLVDSYAAYHGSAAELGNRPLQSFASELPGKIPEAEPQAWTGSNDPWSQSTPVRELPRGSAVETVIEARPSDEGKRHAREGKQHAREVEQGPVPASFATAGSSHGQATPQGAAIGPTSSSQADAAPVEGPEEGDYAAWAKYYRECAAYFEQADGQAQADSVPQEAGGAARKTAKPKKKAAKPSQAMGGAPVPLVAERALPSGMAVAASAPAAAAPLAAPSAYAAAPAARAPGYPCSAPTAVHEEASYGYPCGFSAAEPWVGNPGHGQHYAPLAGHFSSAGLATQAAVPGRGIASQPAPGDRSFGAGLPGYGAGLQLPRAAGPPLASQGIYCAHADPGCQMGGPCGSLPLHAAITSHQRDAVEGEDEELPNLLMSWYFSGYYTGLYAARSGRHIGTPAGSLPALAALGGGQRPGGEGDDEGLPDLLMAWHLSGYHTGLYAARQGI